MRDRFQSTGLGQVTLARGNNSRVRQQLGVLEGQEVILPAVSQCSSEGEDASSRTGSRDNKLLLSPWLPGQPVLVVCSKHPLRLLSHGVSSVCSAGCHYRMRGQPETDHTPLQQPSSFPCIAPWDTAGEGTRHLVIKEQLRRATASTIFKVGNSGQSGCWSWSEGTVEGTLIL